MILGVGLDICQVSRMAEAINHPRFLTRVFSESEQAYLTEKGSRAAESAAGLYAAKEAFLKARGTGIDSLALSQIGVDHDALGRPYYVLGGVYGTEDMAAHLSISHDGGVAAAVCVLERREPAGGNEHADDGRSGSGTDA